LYLRATLPPKNGVGSPTRQRIPVGSVTVESIRWAEARAFELSSQLLQDCFSWQDWLSPSQVERVKLAEEVIDEFERYYRSTHTLTQRTWDRHWKQILNRLRPDKPLSADGFLKIVLRTSPDTRDRQITCRRLQSLADYCGIPVNLSEYAGSYRRAKTAPLDLPNDQQIADLIESIYPRSKRWANYLALIAAYGLRAHEAHKVTEGKTGTRLVYPPNPEWPKLWGLHPEMLMPDISGRDYMDITQRVSKAFQRLSIPYPTRTFRYCYVVRAVVVYGYPIPVVAQWCGHSPEVLMSTYSRYISSTLHRETYRSKLSVSSAQTRILDSD
jgi:integrase